MITVETKIENQSYCTLKWGCDNPRIYYFNVYRGIHPEDTQLLARTVNISLGNVPLRTPTIDGTVYIQIDACDSSDTVIDSIRFRVTPSQINNYLKYRKWFEYNFLKAARSSAAGVRLAMLQRRQQGAPCSRCSNSLTGEPQDSGCSVCYGTGFEGGFYTPIIVWGLRGAKTEASSVSGNSAPVKKIVQNFILPPYPMLQPRDYLVDLEDWSMYEVTDRGKQTVEMDHQRMGSVMYPADMLTRMHPIAKFPIADSLTTIEEIILLEGQVVIKGKKLRPVYGITSVSIRNLEHLDAVTVDEKIKYAEDLQSVTDTQLVFIMDSGYTGKHCRYRAVINNEFFEGEINNG